MASTSDTGSASGAPHSPGALGAPALAAAEQKKRNRIRFSCTTCREKKLKCNRALPCDQCQRRNITHACAYVPYLHSRASGHGSTAAATSPRGQRQQSEDAQSLQNKLRYLEEVVHGLRARLGEDGILGEDQVLIGREFGGEDANSTVPETLNDLRGVKEPTIAGSMVGKLRYVDAANWEAILDDVTKLTNELKATDDIEDEDDDQDSAIDPTVAAQEGPVLLLGSFPTASLADLTEYLPPRDVTDRLVSRFFKGKEPAWSMFHVPTFLKQYNEFWNDPQSYSITWIGLLFIMISHAALFCLRGDEEIPGNLGTPQYVSDLFRIRSAQCLALDDYTKPGKYKVETLILYFGIEYLRLSDAQRGTSIIMSIIVRLAMHTGLHRDPKHFPGISAFEGEMRKRLWTILTEIDVLVSFQFGLHANVQSRYFDTGLPHNLLDEDFDESTTELPQERPFTERTPALYTIVKSRIVVAFSDILSRMADKDSPTYREVLRLDKDLEAAHEAIPPVLRMRSFGLSITDPIDLIMQRLWIELMFQKARIVLHRRYFALARSNIRYEYSRFACIDAATRTLEYQFDVHTEIQPGGRLSKERWFLSSLSTHDFLLADMMLCLELSYLLEQTQDTEMDWVSKAPITKERLLEIIRTSRNIWQMSRKDSAEGNRAFKILSRMLSISTGTQYESSPDSGGVDIGMDLNQRPSYQFASGPGVRGVIPQQTPGLMWTTGGLPVGTGHPAWTQQPEFGPEDTTGCEVVIDPSMTVDWASWDTQIQNTSAEMLQIPWSAFFRTS